jgi:hypothetical protein
MPDSWQDRPQLPASRRPPGLSDQEYAFRLTLAIFVGGRLTRDGNISGYFDWWLKATQRQRALADHYAAWCARKVERDHRDPEECAESAAHALRERLDSDPAREERSSVQVAPGMIGLIWDTAVRINALCDAAESDSSTRERMHRLHGEMIARGCTSPDDVLRTVGATIESQRAAREAAAGVGG